MEGLGIDAVRVYVSVIRVGHQPAHRGGHGALAALARTLMLMKAKINFNTILNSLSKSSALQVFIKYCAGFQFPHHAFHFFIESFNSLLTFFIIFRGALIKL